MLAVSQPTAGRYVHRKGEAIFLVATVVVFGLFAFTHWFRDNLLLVRLMKGERADVRLAKTSTASWIAGPAFWKAAPAANAERLALLAREAWGHGKHDRAIEQMRTAADLVPTSGDYVNQLGIWRIDQKQIPALQADLQSILTRAPLNATALAYRGWIARSPADLDRALAIDSDNAAALQFSARLLIETNGPRDRIEQLLLRGDRRWPDDPFFYYALAQFYIQAKDYAKAEPYVRRLADQRSDDAYAIEVVADYQLKRKNYFAALDAYRAAARLLPSEPRFEIGIGDALGHLGNPREAALAYARAASMENTKQ